VIRFLADENFDRHIVRGLRRWLPNIDIALAQEAGLAGMDDEVLLEWAAQEQRLVLSHDRRR
jgi:predicted nuclease of predicted toxin-antitoxin system